MTGSMAYTREDMFNAYKRGGCDALMAYGIALEHTLPSSVDGQTAIRCVDLAVRSFANQDMKALDDLLTGQSELTG
jgi:hypothetical protein